MVSFVTGTRRRGSSPGSASGALERRVVTTAIGALSVGLAAATAMGPIGILAGVVVSVYVAVLAVLGRERTAILTLMGGFATAPMYKGLAPFGSQVTPTDALLVLGFALLLPELIKGHFDLPLSYVVGISVVVLAVCVSSALAVNPAVSFFSSALWLVVLAGLPLCFALWRPPRSVVDVLAWSYIAGHLFNTAYAVAITGPVVDNRYMGLAFHPNYFAGAATISVTLLLYLFWARRGRVSRIFVGGAMAIALVSVLLSGSRGATLVVAVLFLMIPIVERSAVIGFVGGLAAAIGLVALPIFLTIGADTSLGRLAGGGSAAGSNSARLDGVRDGIAQFWERPLLGHGFYDPLELAEVHNNILEVAVAVGVFGLVGYLLVMYAFARPLFGNGRYRRLCYTAWASIGFGATIPSLYDRDIWVPIALSTVAIVTTARGEEAGTERETSELPRLQVAREPSDA